MGVFRDPRAVLREYGLAAKKSWGQCFLVDRFAHEAIVLAADLSEDSWVVELGAGLGTLTSRLAAAVPRGRLIAVERDRDMARVLREELSGASNVDLQEDNALTFDYQAAFVRAKMPLSVVGNLPYQIASQLIFAALDARAYIRRAVFMVQKEMADRIVAAPGSKTYGALSVMVQTYADAEIVRRVGAGSFHPAPRVDSAVLGLMCLSSPREPLADEVLHSQVVHAAFAQRRKTLRNALGAAFDKAVVLQVLTAAAIDGGRRGETLSLAEFAALTNAFSRHA